MKKARSCFIVCLLLFNFQAGAATNACKSFVERYNKNVEAGTFAYVQSFRATLNIEPKDMDYKNVDHCTKAVPLFKQRIAAITELIAPFNNGLSRGCFNEKDGAQSRYAKSFRSGIGVQTPAAAVERYEGYVAVCERLVAASIQSKRVGQSSEPLTLLNSQQLVKCNGVSAARAKGGGVDSSESECASADSLPTGIASVTRDALTQTGQGTSSLDAADRERSQASRSMLPVQPVRPGMVVGSSTPDKIIGGTLSGANQQSVPIQNGNTSGAKKCVGYFETMSDQFYQNATLCLKETRLIQSLADLLKGRTLYRAPASIAFTRNSLPDAIGIVDPMDPGWTIASGELIAHCDVPIRVSSQATGFSECARVYACGYMAAQCGLEMAQKTNEEDCTSISRACLAQYPVPQRVMASPPTSPGLLTLPSGEVTGDRSQSGISPAATPARPTHQGSPGGDAR